MVRFEASDLARSNEITTNVETQELSKEFQWNWNHHPVSVYGQGYLDKFKRLLAEGSQEYSSYGAGERTKTAAWAMGALATQSLDRARIVILTAPPASLAVLEQTDSPVAAGVTAAGIFASWNYSAGDVLRRAIGRFPRTVNGFKEEFPTELGLLADGLPGIREQDSQTNTNAIEKQTEQGSLLANLRLRLRRSVTGLTLGSTAFIGTASAQGYDQKSIKNINKNVTLDASSLTFAIAFASSEAINVVGDENPELASDIQKYLGDWRFWVVVAGASIYSEYRQNKKKREEVEKNR